MRTVGEELYSGGWLQGSRCKQWSHLAEAGEECGCPDADCIMGRGLDENTEMPEDNANAD